MLCINCQNSFLGAFAKLRKATISVVLPVLPSAPTGQIFFKVYM